jgi:hypothetical protein
VNKLSNQEKNNQNISENIKNGAGAVFHSVHKGLEATENAAMNAVDATANAIDNLTDNDKR